MIKYDNYNREERAACAHLFRLLHEKLENKTKSPLGLLLQRLSTKKLAYATPHFDLTELNFDNVGIFFEVAILRDAYNRRKDDMHPFMDALTRVIMQQENVTACTLFSKLPAVLNDPKETHPRQIKQKAAEQGVRFTPAEMKVYGAMQGMFNAKPDLAITVDGMLLVVEAKFTENFDAKQLQRTWNVAEVWAKLLSEDLGFAERPDYAVVKLGAASENPEISWTDIQQIANATYKEDDRTRLALQGAVNLLARIQN